MTFKKQKRTLCALRVTFESLWGPKSLFWVTFQSLCRETNSFFELCHSKSFLVPGSRHPDCISELTACNPTCFRIALQARRNPILSVGAMPTPHSGRPSMFDLHMYVLACRRLIMGQVYHYTHYDLGCRKWGCNKWGFKGCLADLPGNWPKSAFFSLFLPFSPFFRGYLGNPENGGKRPFSSDILRFA